MHRFRGSLGAALVSLFVAVVAFGCSRSDINLDDGLGSGDDASIDSPTLDGEPEGAPGPKCGNNVCDSGENCMNCALDCGICPGCGDGKCQENETCASCPADCGDCPSCGDGKCEMPQENCQTCAPDCGVCPGCGDGKCTAPNETCFSCPKDCGNCMGCGDGICESNETCASCEIDCGPCSVCGNGKCEPPYETCVNCPSDCGQCPVHTCFQALTCAIGCFGGLGGGGGGGGGGGILGDGGIPLTCTVDCLAETCTSGQYFANQALNCIIQQLFNGTCMGLNINCLMMACQSSITACLDNKCP